MFGKEESVPLSASLYCTDRPHPLVRHLGFVWARLITTKTFLRIFPDVRLSHMLTMFDTICFISRNSVMSDDIRTVESFNF